VLTVLDNILIFASKVSEGVTIIIIVTCSVQLLRFDALTICLLPVTEHWSPVFPCSDRPDESRWWKVDLKHASSRIQGVLESLMTVSTSSL